MYPIWNIQEFSDHVLLYKCDDLNYWVTRQGEWTHLIVCDGLFTIVSQEMLSFLEQHVKDGFTSHPVSIYDRPSNSYIPGYHRIYIRELLPFNEDGSLNGADVTGMKIWALEENKGVFISTDLRLALERTSMNKLTYFAGLSGYGG
jgi:hypothetical protein